LLALEHPNYSFPDKALNRVPSSYSEAWQRLNWNGGDGSWPMPQVLTSIDAAAALCKRVFPDSEWDLSSHDGLNTALAVALIWRAESAFEVRGAAATPPRAFCAAIIKAKKEAAATAGAITSEFRPEGKIAEEIQLAKWARRPDGALAARFLAFELSVEQDGKYWHGRIDGTMTASAEAEWAVQHMLVDQCRRRKALHGRETPQPRAD
jgi:hypothetical protein